MPLIRDLETAYLTAKDDPAFIGEMADLPYALLRRPAVAALFRRAADPAPLGGAKEFYLKREELNHTGSHKINNCLSQILLAKRMGKTRVIAETGAGQAWCRHGDQSSAKFEPPCTIFMGATDVERQYPNVTCA